LLPICCGINNGPSQVTITKGNLKRCTSIVTLLGGLRQGSDTELGWIVRKVFLLEYISDRGLRREIKACTNVVEGYNHFLDWIFFGKEGGITENDPEAQEKHLKYLDLVANAVIFHNAVDFSLVIQQLKAEGFKFDRSMLSTLSTYLTRHLKRYGDIVIDLQSIPFPLEGAILIPLDSE
jgi:hypothetical protein